MIHPFCDLSEDVIAFGLDAYLSFSCLRDPDRYFHFLSLKRDSLRSLFLIT
jgi:hypothetical protein